MFDRFSLKLKSFQKSFVKETFKNKVIVLGKAFENMKCLGDNWVSYPSEYHLKSS